MRYRQGSATFFNNDYEDPSYVIDENTNQFNSNQNIHGSSYKQAPFTNENFDYSNASYQQNPNY